MPYVPINPTIFCAAFAGSLSGMVAAGRYISSPAPAPADSANLTAVALAFAAAYDTEWDNPANPCEFEVLATE